MPFEYLKSSNYAYGSFKKEEGEKLNTVKAVIKFGDYDDYTKSTFDYVIKAVDWNGDPYPLGKDNTMA